MPEQPKPKEQVDAEIRRTLAEARKAELEADHEAFEIRSDEFWHAQKIRDAREKDASDDRHHVYYFNESVSSNSVAKLRATLNKWHRLEPECRIEIVLNSPGGSVFDGFDAFDCIRCMSSQGHKVTTRIAGIAASMAGILAQAGDVRIIGGRSYLHIHEVSTGAMGKASDLKDTAELAKRLTWDACRIYAERSTLTAQEIYDKVERQEWYLDPVEALDNKFVDAIQ